MSQNEKMKAIASVTSANLISETQRRMLESEKGTVELGTKFELESKAGQVDRGKAIVRTAGNKTANQQLIKYINLLLTAMHKKYPYKPLIEKRRRQVLQAFNIAMGAHYSTWEQLIQEGLIKAIRNNALFESSNVIPKDLVELLNKFKDEVD